MQIKVGDALSCDGDQYLVVARAVCRDVSAPWVEFRLTPIGHDHELALVELREALYAGPTINADWEQGATEIAIDEQLFRWSQHGKAPYEFSDRDGKTRFDRVEFWHYEALGGSVIIDTEAHDGRQVRLLHPIDQGRVEVYAA